MSLLPLDDWRENILRDMLPSFVFTVRITPPSISRDINEEDEGEEEEGEEDEEEGLASPCFKLERVAPVFVSK